MTTLISIRDAVSANGNHDAMYSPAKEKAANRGTYVCRSPLLLRRFHQMVIASKAKLFLEKPDPAMEKKPSGGSIDRDVALAEVEKEKRLSFIKAWEESEKTQAENIGNEGVRPSSAAGGDSDAVLHSVAQQVMAAIVRNSREQGGLSAGHSSSIKKFIKMNPPTFSGGTDLAVAEKWV
ncbi:remorin-like [Malania oleifera]|uniref:remorin-like n=1 Tax=Malania oleifera TaxID=397392 RepID=UPI0025AEC289|nr:remorin-like [Malania oleifera]